MAVRKIPHIKPHGKTEALNVNQHLPSKEVQYTSAMSLSDLEAIRLVLSGDSVVEWFRLNFRSEDEILWFLKVNGYDWNNIHDQKRLHKILKQAIGYLDTHFPHRISHEFRTDDMNVLRLLECASYAGRRSKTQSMACLILKIMHTINHIDARELLHRCQLPPSDLYQSVVKKVEETVDAMQGEDFHIVDFYGSHKDKNSIITKLIAKKENHAAAILDRIRFRIITLTLDDILPVLYYLGRTICPFNYIIPNSSHNNLITFSDLLAHYPHFRHYAYYVRQHSRALQELKTAPENTFTSPEYKMINIVADVPIRADEFLYSPEFAEYGRIVFVTVEFQIVDQYHYQINEIGEGSHQKYKLRQLRAVRTRLGIEDL
jgi:uncharacterized protein (TIGR04552 family)